MYITLSLLVSIVTPLAVLPTATEAQSARAVMQNEEANTRPQDMQNGFALTPIEVVSELERRPASGRSQQRQAFEDHARQQLGERQQQAALRATEGMNRSNISLTSQYLRYLDLMEMVLEKIEARASLMNLEEAGIEPVLAAATAAHSSIAEARLHAQAQLEKEYVAEITDAQSIGASLRAVIAELRNDHQHLRDTYMSSVRTAMQEAFLALQTAASAAGNTEEQADTAPAQEDTTPAQQPLPESTPAPTPLPLTY